MIEEQLLNYADQLIEAMKALSSPTADLILKTVQIEGGIYIFNSFMLLVAASLGGVISLKLYRYFKSKDSDDGMVFWGFVVFMSAAVAAMAVIRLLTCAWSIVALFYPEVYLAKQAMDVISGG